MRKFKRIWKEEGRFVVSDDNFLYEVSVNKRGLPKRQLQPTFENRFWEVYALHRQNGLYYAVIGKHHDVRVFYGKNILFSRTGRFYIPMGRDLAVKAMGDVFWNVLSAKKGQLFDITSDFFAYTSRAMVYVSDVKYLSPVVCLLFKSPPHFHEDDKVYLKQGECGYVKIPEGEVRQQILRAKYLPEDPWFV